MKQSVAPSKVESTLTVVVLERPRSLIHICKTNGPETRTFSTLTEWDPSPHLVDLDGRRLFEEIIRRVRSAWDEYGTSTTGVIVTLPGTLEGSETIVSSSRLGIRTRVPAAQIISAGLGVPCRLYHDVECLALGEDQYARSTGGQGSISQGNTLTYIFAEEGVGSKTIIDAKTHLGAGVAGTLGRLTVQPDGSYYKALSARGPLEVFSSRPWISENLVAMYLSERDKNGATLPALEQSNFRRSLRVAASGDWSSIDYEYIADGIATQDPIAQSVLDVAARYLGFAINSVIAILHPHKIVLGGAVLTRLPGFVDHVIAYARSYSWPLAWNSTNIALSSLGRDAQIYGAIQLWAKTFN